jgi:hypothetical protein
MKKGDVVKREFHFGTGDRIIEGVVIEIEIRENTKAKKFLRIAVDGDLTHINLSPVDKCEKINKEIRMHKNGKISLF